LTFNAYEYSLKIDQSGLRKCWHLFACQVFIGQWKGHQNLMLNAVHSDIQYKVNKAI